MRLMKQFGRKNRLKQQIDGLRVYRVYVAVVYRSEMVIVH